MRKKLDFDEISNWQEFENLVADYFKEIKKLNDNIIDVKVEPSGEGADGGRDILITFRLTDSIVSFERKWVVQCKFYEKAVSKANLASVNIPTLIHEYGANGYLLVCKGNVTSKVSEMFENLRRNCKLGYNYEIWQGNDLQAKLRVQDALIESYFPEYNEFQKRNEGMEKIK